MPCIVIYFHSKINQMHQCLKFIYFYVTLYMFRTVFPSIVRSSRLYIQQQAYVNQILLLLAVYSRELLMMDGKTVPKHVDYSKIKSIWDIGASGWFYYKNRITTTSLHFSANVLKYCAILLYCHQHVRHQKHDFETFTFTFQNALCPLFRWV